MIDELPAIRRFIEAKFPAATIAVVGGSTARNARTPTSDIDLLLIGPQALFDDDRDNLAGFYVFEGEGFEVFAFTESAFDQWAEHVVAGLRPVLQDLLLEGFALRETPLLQVLRQRWRPIIDAGPSLDSHELAVRRYSVTDALDDLSDASDPLERQIIAAILFTQLGELLLLAHGHWIGTGKWLVRRMRAWDAARTDALAAPLLAGDITAFVSAASEEVERLGGRVEDELVR